MQLNDHLHEPQPALRCSDVRTSYEQKLLSELRNPTDNNMDEDWDHINLLVTSYGLNQRTFPLACADWSLDRIDK